MHGLYVMRTKRGLTQSELAEKLGVRSSTISQYESGKRSPNVKMLTKLAKVLKCTVSKLVEE